VNLEYLRDGSPDCPLIRLYGFTKQEANQVLHAIELLATGSAPFVDVHELPCVESIGDCRLRLLIRTWDQGIMLKARPAAFECGFTSTTWDNVAGLVEPFAQEADGFQWLAGTPGEPALLLSVDGMW
jgi:hypothetical protein